MSKLSKAERRRQRREAKEASRALVVVPTKPLAPATKSAHIPSAQEAEMLAFKAPIEYETPTIPFSRSAEKLPSKPLETPNIPVNAVREMFHVGHSRRRPWWITGGLYLTAFLLYGAEIATNVWSAWGSDLSLTAIPLLVAIGASTGWFFTFPLIREGRVIAVVACVVFLGFALFNGFRLQTTLAADQAQARMAQIAATLNTACGAATTTTVTTKSKTTKTTTGESAGCGVVRAVPVARPEVEAFAKFAVWAFRWHPSDADYDNLRLVLWLIVLQMGGPVLLLARR
jgi:hypothetical protein